MKVSLILKLSILFLNGKKVTGTIDTKNELNCSGTQAIVLYEEVTPWRQRQLPFINPDLFPTVIEHELPRLSNKKMCYINLKNVDTKISLVQEREICSKMTENHTEHCSVSRDMLKRFENEIYLRNLNRRFDSLNLELNKIREMENLERYNGNRFKRSSVLGRQPQCKVSLEKLKQFKRVVEDTLSEKMDVSEIICDLDFDGSNNCDTLVKLLQCGLHHIKNGLMTMLGDKKNYAESVGMYKAALTSLQQKYDTLADDIRQSVSQEYEKKVADVQTRLQDLQSTIVDPAETICIVSECGVRMIFSKKTRKIAVVKLCHPLLCTKITDLE